MITKLRPIERTLFCNWKCSRRVTLGALDLLKLFTRTTFIAATLLATTALASAEDQKPGTISVTGIGTIAAAPDMATINLTVLREAETAKVALAENNAAMNEILSAMKAFDIEDKDLQTSNFSIHPRYVYPKNNNQ